MKQLILASKSPRRQEMLKNIGLDFSVRTADIDESIVTTEDPTEKVKQLAHLKAKHVPINKQEVVIAADTVVAYENNIFGKPSSIDDAYEMISKLSGQTHEVFTGVSIHSHNKEVNFVERTAVEWWNLSEEMIQWYIQTEEPYDKAGAYGIQHLGALLVKGIKGDYFNVVGLPIAQVVRKLQVFGIYAFEK